MIGVRREVFKMKRFFRTSTIIIALGLAVSCSEQEFSSVPSNTCNNLNSSYGEKSCVEDPETGLNTFNYEVGSCKADILFVVDNSGSMYEDQIELAKRFPNFLSAINDLDYHIAVTTTDVSASPNNYDPNNVELSARQDGKLIKFPDGSKFITKSTPNAQSAFEKTVKREETEKCDNGQKSACPSSDERGIYAVNYAIYSAQQRGNLGPNLFFRPDSHLAIVFLSDENVRSDLGFVTASSLYKPVNEDRPQALIDYVKSTFGKAKTFSAHPIVIQSKLTYADASGNLLGIDDYTCHTAQANQANTSNKTMIRYGTWYEQLAVAATGNVDGSVISDLGGLVPGHAGSICEGNYTPILSKIGQSITKNSQASNLLCEPTDLTITIGGVQLTDGEYQLNGTRLQLPPTCQKVKVSYKCPRSI